MVFWYHQRWREDGVVDRLHDALRDRVRDASDRDPMASAGCVDAESVNRPDTVAAAVRGFDAGTKVNGRKRHRVVDTMGLSLLVVNASASVQDRRRARTRLDRLTMAMPSLLWADGGYAGKLLDWSDWVAHITVEIVRKPLGIKMFQALPARWVVERIFAWIVKAAASTTTTSDWRMGMWVLHDHLVRALGAEALTSELLSRVSAALVDIMSPEFVGSDLLALARTGVARYQTPTRPE
jgi:transposase